MPRKAKGSTEPAANKEVVEEEVKTVVKRQSRNAKKPEAVEIITEKVAVITKAKGKQTKATTKQPQAEDSAGDGEIDADALKPVEEQSEASKPKRGRGKAAKAEEPAVDDTTAVKAKGRGKGKGVAESVEPEDNDTPASKKRKVAKSDETEKTTKGEAASAEKVVIEKSEIKRTIVEKSRFKVISWNVTTLRSLVNKNAELLKRLVATEKPDLLCLQEIKLNASDQDEYDRKLKDMLPPCTLHWNFCTAEDSKSYAGSLAIVLHAGEKPAPNKKTIDQFFSSKTATKAPSTSEPETTTASSDAGPARSTAELIKVTMDLPTLTESDGAVGQAAQREGRTITLEYDRFTVVACYVPNSGDKLQRLAFRTQVWDARMADYLASLEARTRRPVIFCGDLNVAHLDEDIWNVGAKHLVKTPGTTKEERAGFAQLLSRGFVDAFRRLHPAARGWFTYWSVRAGNLAFNRGLRLDYFVTSPTLYAGTGGGAGGAAETTPVVRDVAILSEYIAVDHAAIALTLEL